MQREKMWTIFHQVRISHSFRDSWIKFLKITDCEAVPVFYQFVTNALMEQIVKLRYMYPVLFSSDIDEDEVTLNYEERCAVRYTAGYTIRSLLKKVKCSRNKQKEELKKCLQDMIESSEESLHDSISWTKAVDRGGLIHVNDCDFDVFAEMEIVLRKNLKACKQDLCQVVEVIVNDDNILFACALASAS